MKLDDFLTYIPAEVDIRPHVADVAKRYIRLKEVDDAYPSQSAVFLNRVIKKTELRHSKFTAGTGTSDPAENVINGWNREEVSKRGKPALPAAVMFWLFRFASEPSYFIELASITWGRDPELCKRFCYAREGAHPDDPDEIVYARFRSEEALIYKNISIGRRPESSANLGQATELSSPHRPGHGGLLTFTRGTAILDEQHAERVLGHLVNIERHRDRVEGRLLLPGTMIEDDADGAIAALTAYAMRASDTTALATILNALFEVAVWSDAEAYARRGAYAVLGADYLAKMDMTQPHAVRLGMELAHVFHVNGDQQNGKRILVLLPGLQELPDDPATAKALLRRADTVYELDKLGYDAVSDFLTQRFGSHCSLQGASMWRCAACAVLKSKRYEEALAYVEECKRQLSSVSSLLLSMEDRLIPAYLGVIATIAKVNLQPQLLSDEAAIKNLGAILAVVKDEAVGYEPLIIGIRSELIKLQRGQVRRKAHDNEQNIASISKMKLQIERTINTQIKVMCFFDFNQIKQYLFALDDKI